MEVTADAATADLSAILVDPDRLVRAIATGRVRGRPTPQWRRVELRPVRLAVGDRLQIVTFTDTQSFTANHPWSDAPGAIAPILAEAFGTWVVDWTDEGQGRRRTVRPSRRGPVRVHDEQIDVVRDQAHDRRKDRLVDPEHPLVVAAGLSRADGRIPADRQAKFRQVEQFVRLLAADLPEPVAGRPMRVVDLGCGNAYLTFAAAAWLDTAGVDFRIHGVDTRASARDRNTEIVGRAGLADRVTFSAEPIAATSAVEGADVVLALHACDTATDDALAVAVRHDVPVVLAAPCCHHDLARQLSRPTQGAPRPEWARAMLRDGILRERFADVLTDAIRADLLRAHGYRVEAVEFVESRHTPRNTLLRAHRTGVDGSAASERVQQAMAMWSLQPRLAALLPPPAC